MARRKRTTHYYGLATGAACNERDRSLALGCVEHEPVFGSIKFRPSCRLVGKTAATLLARLDAIRTDLTLAPRDRAAAYDVAIAAIR